MDFSGYYLNVGNLPVNEKFIFEGIVFNFPAFNYLNQDNIALSGQTISIPEDQYKELYLLGCSIQGSFPTKVKLKFQSGIEVIKEIGFSECGNFDNIYFGEKIALKLPLWQYQVFDGEINFFKGEQLAGRIYLQTIEIDSNDFLTEIQFEDNIFIHLFAITGKK